MALLVLLISSFFGAGLVEGFFAEGVFLDGIGMVPIGSLLSGLPETPGTPFLRILSAFETGTAPFIGSSLESTGASSPNSFLNPADFAITKPVMGSALYAHPPNPLLEFDSQNPVHLMLPAVAYIQLPWRYRQFRPPTSHWR